MEVRDNLTMLNKAAKLALLGIREHFDNSIISLFTEGACS
jgi:hypothetical protein